MTGQGYIKEDRIDNRGHNTCQSNNFGLLLAGELMPSGAFPPIKFILTPKLRETKPFYRNHTSSPLETGGPNLGRGVIRPRVKDKREPF